uniref:Small ribosomal subunit protein bS20c n=1 Tax=Dichotomaria marginata TaxID=268567 RepID=A0A1G4NSB5_9FLOR|nr:Ribosomal protein S20 [Dichotomaria marginata]SCW21553.1 Ribosomal protein S20 [Dichotomaria marginata]
MTKNLSITKSITISERNRYINKIYKSTIRTLTKKLIVESLRLKGASDKYELYDLISSIYSKIDKAVKKGVLHKNNAARKKAYLAKIIK